MLILSRKTNESIIINGNIEIKVIASEDGKVRIGISAPRDVIIHRKEVYDKIMEENTKAVLSKDKVLKIGRGQFKDIKKKNNNLLK